MERPHRHRRKLATAILHQEDDDEDDEYSEATESRRPGRPSHGLGLLHLPLQQKQRPRPPPESGIWGSCGGASVPGAGGGDGGWSGADVGGGACVSGGASLFRLHGRAAEGEAGVWGF
ncbi:hypothetical protein AAC387_Pa02g3736 [Persea americana]